MPAELAVGVIALSAIRTRLHPAGAARGRVVVRRWRSIVTVRERAAKYETAKNAESDGCVAAAAAAHLNHVADLRILQRELTGSDTDRRRHCESRSRNRNRGGGPDSEKL